MALSIQLTDYFSDMKKRKTAFFIPVEVLRDKFKGKYLSLLNNYYQNEKLIFSSSCQKLRNSYEWKDFKNKLYEKDWCPFIKKSHYLQRTLQKIQQGELFNYMTKRGLKDFQRGKYGSTAEHLTSL